MQTVTQHPFEIAGLGAAPFDLLGVTEEVLRLPCGHTQHAGTCDYCSRGIKYCCHIGSHDGKRFVVGTDCVRKLNRIDNRLLNEVEKAVAKMNREKKEAERAAKWESACKTREAALQAERDRNGGLTDAEVKAKTQRDAERIRAAEMEQVNGWLLNVINGMSGDFIGSMIERLQQTPAKDLPERCVSILCDIYAKATGGRSGSKKYNTACEEFSRLAGLE